MLRQLLRNRLSVVLLIVCCLIAIGGIYKSLWHTQPMQRKEIDEISTPDTGEQTRGIQKNEKFSGKLPHQKNNFEGNSHSPLPVPMVQISEDKRKKISKLYGHRSGRDTSWATGGPPREEVEILVEGMDDLSAARYLKMLGGYDEYAREYAARALAENPDDFEALFIWTKLQELDADRETGFRKLLEMNPNFVPVLIELGAMLARDAPEEAIEYMERANRLRPDTTLFYLGVSYQRVGEYDKALAVLNRAHELNRAPMALAHIQAIEAGTPRVPLIQREVEEPWQTETEGQDTGRLLPDADPSTPPESIEAERLTSESSQIHTENTQREEDIRAFFERMTDAEFSAFKQFVTQEFPELLTEDFSELSQDESIARQLREGQDSVRFSPERLNHASETLNRYGPEEGLRRLRKGDPEIAEEVGRLINRKSPSGENDVPLQ